MKLHIFNPEHDIALAANLSNFTAPKAGRELRHDLGFLPALWTEKEDIVLVDDVEEAERSLREVSTRIVPVAGTMSTNYWYNKYQRLVQQVPTAGTYSVDPWGWDRALCAQLKRMGVKEEVLPDDDQLQRIRELSHRRTAVELLRKLSFPGRIEYSCCTDSIADIKQMLTNYGHIVLKAPWSSSGRGIRFINEKLEDVQKRWIKNIVEEQGCVVIEPYYNKVTDFGMEFTVDAKGLIRYEGLSLFQTKNGAYTGNLLATENTKEKMISSYIPVNLLRIAQEEILLNLNLSGYQGPFGIDMMVIERNGQQMLHPCVEINLRRTMGHVALALHRHLNPTLDDQFLQVMQIGYDGSHYRLSCQNATAAAAATLSESTP